MLLENRRPPGRSIITARLTGVPMSSSRRLVPLSLAAALLAFTALPVAAQRVARPNLIATDPIGAIFGAYSLNFERAVAMSQSIGFGVSYLEPVSGSESDDEYDDYRVAYATFDLNYRYYPRDVFRGWSLGASVGASRVGEDRPTEEFPAERSITTDRATTIGFGFNLGYNWLMGRDDRLHVGLGIGAKRHFVMSGDEFADGAKSFALPTGRFSIGLAF